MVSKAADKGAMKERPDRVRTGSVGGKDYPVSYDAEWREMGRLGGDICRELPDSLLEASS